MSETKWTPGPWHLMTVIQTDASGREIRDHAAGVIIGAPDHGFSGDECEVDIDGPNAVANAQLIAAAPDLYAALQEVISVSDRATDIYDRARAALAKARGER